jgi:hypothetical protein
MRCLQSFQTKKSEKDEKKKLENKEIHLDLLFKCDSRSFLFQQFVNSSCIHELCDNVFFIVHSCNSKELLCCFFLGFE